MLSWFSLLAIASAALAQSQQPTFAHDIAPIIYKECTSCHRPGQAAPFNLLTYNDVKQHVQQILAVTRSRYMPPWPPQPGYGEFEDERHLTDQQIRLITDWVKARMPEGSKAEIPPPPRFASDWQLGQPDMILEAERPLVLAPSGPDVFWNFIFKPDLTTHRYVRAIEIRPGASDRSIHHANLIIDRTGSALRLESTPGAGFPGMDLTIDRNPFDPDSHFLFWKPGTLPYSEPDGFSWRLNPGNLLVLNTHLQPTGKPEQVQPSLGLYFTASPPTRFPLLIQLEHDGALNIPAGSPDFLVMDDFRLPIDVDVLAIYPHAHYLGTLLEAYATLPGGSRKWLIRIPHWDLNWQAVYRYREPLLLPRNTVISMRYHYDNSTANPRNPNNPPKRVRAGNNATDEMSHLWLQVLPRGGGNRRLELQQALLEHRLEKYPGDFSAHLNLGAVMLARLNPSGAVSALEAASHIDPTRPEPHDMLGEALESVGRRTEAITQFRLALQVDSNYLDARYNLANALAKCGKLDEAIQNLKLVASAYPKNARLRDQLGELLIRSSRFSEGLAQFNQALVLDPSDETARKNRDFLLHQTADR